MVNGCASVSTISSTVIQSWFAMEGEEQIDINDPCSSYYDSDDNNLVFDSSDDLILCALPNSSDEDDNIPFEDVIPEGPEGSLNCLRSESHTQSSINWKGTRLVFDQTAIAHYYDYDVRSGTEERWINPSERRVTSTLYYSPDGHGSNLFEDGDSALFVEDDRNILVAQNNIDDDDDGYDLIIEDVVSDDGEIISRRITQMTEEEMENKENIAVGMSTRSVSDAGENDWDDHREFTGSNTRSTPLHTR